MRRCKQIRPLPVDQDGALPGIVSAPDLLGVYAGDAEQGGSVVGLIPWSAGEGPTTSRRTGAAACSPSGSSTVCTAATRN